MKPIRAWAIGGVGGAVFGYLLAIQPYGDLWLGSVLAVVSAVAIFGAVQFPEHLFKSPLSTDNPWIYFISILAVVVILVPSMGPVLEDRTNIAILAYFGVLWIGGISAGIALERRSGDSPES